MRCMKFRPWFKTLVRNLIAYGSIDEARVVTNALAVGSRLPHADALHAARPLSVHQTNFQVKKKEKSECLLSICQPHFFIIYDRF